MTTTTSVAATAVRRATAVLVCAAISVGAALATSGEAVAAAGSDRLRAGEQLNPGQRLVSPDGQYVLTMQGDGNLVEYAPGNRAIWATGTNRSNSIVLLQGDGNLVVIAPGNVPVWASGTSGTSGADVELQNDGNVVIYGQGHVARWAKGGGSSSSRAESAISWYMQRVGQVVYDGNCEKAVENAYGVDLVYTSARANWNSRVQRTPYSAAPRGALVFYDTSANAHVAISLGDGRVVSTSVNHKIGIVPIGYFQNPMGWADSPW